MNKRRITTSILLCLSALILAFVLCVNAFGWFLNLRTFGNVKLQITKINSEVYLYKGIDSNVNGIPDLTDADIEALLPNNPYPSDKYYYQETRAFSYVAKEYALSTSNVGDIDMEMDCGKLYPTQKSVFKFACINNSDMENWITFTYNTKTYSTLDEAKLLSTFTIRVGHVVNNDENGDTESSDISVEFTDKIYFSDYINGVVLSEFDVLSSEDAIEIGGCLDVVNNSNCCDFWVQFEMESYESLKAHDDDFTLTEAEYQAMQGRTLAFPLLKLSLELRVQD